MPADNLIEDWTVQEKREKCILYPKRSKTEAEIAALHQEIETLQNETEQAMHDYEVSPWCCLIKVKQCVPVCDVTESTQCLSCYLQVHSWLPCCLLSVTLSGTYGFSECI